MQGLGFRASGSGFRLGLRVQGLGTRKMAVDEGNIGRGACCRAKNANTYQEFRLYDSGLV